MNIQSNIVIFSVYQDSLTPAENTRNTHTVFAMLSKLHQSFKLIGGRYEGRSELAFILPVSAIEDAINIAKKYNQESILVRYSDKSTYLYTIKDISIHDYKVKEQYIGKWQEVSKKHAETLTAYSEWNGVYWAAL